MTPAREAAMSDAIQLLKADHRNVKALFQQFEQAGDQAAKKRIADEALQELQIHSRLEDELFYPAFRRAAGDEQSVNEAREEHHVADLLIAELQRMRPNAQGYEAKFIVLAENVKHHIEEEESNMLPRAGQVGMDLVRLGEEMTRLAQRLRAGNDRSLKASRAAPRRRRAATRRGRRSPAARTQAIRRAPT